MVQILMSFQPLLTMSYHFDLKTMYAVRFSVFNKEIRK